MNRETTPSFLIATCSRSAFYPVRVRHRARAACVLAELQVYEIRPPRRSSPTDVLRTAQRNHGLRWRTIKRTFAGARSIEASWAARVSPKEGNLYGKAKFMCLVIATAIIGINVPVSAQDVDSGKTAYLSSCAPCHGADARGPGTLAIIFKLQPPDLTTLAKRNDGEFPARAANEIIDGSDLSKRTALAICQFGALMSWSKAGSQQLLII